MSVFQKRFLKTHQNEHVIHNMTQIQVFIRNRKFTHKDCIKIFCSYDIISDLEKNFQE